MMTTTSAREDMFVYTDRLQRTQQELARQEVDFLMVGPSPDLFYLIGTAGHLSERLTLLIVPREDTPVIVAAGFEVPLLARQRDLAEIHPWVDGQNPIELVAQAAGKVQGKTIAVGDDLHSAFLLRLQGTLGGARWVEGGQVLRPLRMIKDGREIELLKEAARRTDDAWIEFITQPIAGLTEQQALRRLLDLTYARGLEPNFGSCGSGPNSASPHHQPGDRVIAPGDAVVFDWGGILGGYHSDVTRSVHVGEPDEEYRRVYATVLAANQAALDAVRPGVPCEAIDLAARSLIEDAGYGAAFLHRVGHGLGLGVHEEPYLVAGNTLPLQAGMVFSDEPGIYLEGRFGVRIEDSVLCTDTGGERLNNAPRELTVVG
jgi:Xaa-Pro aminopeptidase